MKEAPLSQHDRRVQARQAHDRQMARQWRVVLLVAVGVVVVAAGTILLQRYQQKVDHDILRERGDKILQALRERRMPPSYYQGFEVIYAPPSWVITKVDTAGTRGHVLATIDNPSAEGVAGTMIWELRFSRNTSTEWTCTAIITIGAWSDEDGWWE